MSEPTLSALCERLPRRVVLETGARVRAAFAADAKPGFYPPGCCDSCHQDHCEGYAGSDYTESWFEDDRYAVQSGPNKGHVPWALQFCCCVQYTKFKEAIEARLIDVKVLP